MSEDVADEEHPPPAKRVNELWKWLVDGGSAWAETLKSRLPEAMPWIAEVLGKGPLSDVALDNPPNPIAAVEASVACLAPYLYRVIDALFGAEGELVRQAGDYECTNESVMAFFKRGVPPGVVLSEAALVPVAETTVLFCGWLFSLTDLEEAPGFKKTGDDTNQRHSKYCLLNEHVAKALEAATLVRVWEEVK